MTGWGTGLTDAGEVIRAAEDGWLVTGHELALGVLRDAATFTVDDPRFSTARIVGPSMLSLDGAEHARHRGAFARSFRPAEVETRFATIVAGEVDRLTAAMRSPAEIRSGLAGPLAVAVMTTALGLPDVAPDTLRSWYEAFVAAISADGEGAPAEAAATAFGELRSRLRGLSTPGLTDEEYVSNAAVVMFGGIDTTEGMISNLVMHLLTHPEQFALLRADRSLADAAIEESLRLEPAAAVLDRYATSDTVLGPVRVRAGDLVRVSLSAANRDPSVFPEPTRFDIRRTGAGHLAFAHGSHFCFGAPLARMETRAVLDRLLDLPRLRLDPSRPAPSPVGEIFRKPVVLHVVWG